MFIYTALAIDVKIIRGFKYIIKKLDDNIIIYYYSNSIL